MDLRRAVRAVLCVAPVVLVLFVAAAVAAPGAPITQAHSGKTFRLAKGGEASLRLSGKWGWTQPRLSSKAIELTQVAYFVDPGFSEWIIRARSRGTATIRSVGTPGCTGCALSKRSFRVTIVVG